MSEDVRYPSPDRFTLQWLIDPEDDYTRRLIPNNSDAAFKKDSPKPKQSKLLLHYNYGAAAVKRWGRGIEVLQKRAKPPRPPTEPSETMHDRTIAISKRDAAWSGDGGNSQAPTGTEELVESDGQDSWDEDEVMLCFWGNTPAAKQRHLEKVQETTLRMEQWREGVYQGSA